MLLTVREAAGRLAVGPELLRRAVRCGVIGVRVGSRFRIRAQDVEKIEAFGLPKFNFVDTDSQAPPGISQSKGKRLWEST